MCWAPKNPLGALKSVNPISIIKNPKKSLDPRRTFSALTPKKASSFSSPLNDQADQFKRFVD